MLNVLPVIDSAKELEAIFVRKVSEEADHASMAGTCPGERIPITLADGTKATLVTRTVTVRAFIPSHPLTGEGGATE